MGGPGREEEVPHASFYRLGEQAHQLRPAKPFQHEEEEDREEAAPERSPSENKDLHVQTQAYQRSSEKCRAYKEAIKDYIVENAIYEEERLQELFENYKREKQKENEDIVVRAIEELKLQLNVA